MKQLHRLEKKAAKQKPLSPFRQSKELTFGSFRASSHNYHRQIFRKRALHLLYFSFSFLNRTLLCNIEDLSKLDAYNLQANGEKVLLFLFSSFRRIENLNDLFS